MQKKSKPAAAPSSGTKPLTAFFKKKTTEKG